MLWHPPPTHIGCFNYLHEQHRCIFWKLHVLSLIVDCFFCTAWFIFQKLHANNAQQCYTTLPHIHYFVFLCTFSRSQDSLLFLEAAPHIYCWLFFELAGQPIVSTGSFLIVFALAVQVHFLEATYHHINYFSCSLFSLEANCSSFSESEKPCNKNAAALFLLEAKTTAGFSDNYASLYWLLIVFFCIGNAAQPVFSAGSFSRIHAAL